MEQLIELIKLACSYIKVLFTKIINGCLNFFKNVVGWFKSLQLQQGRDVPFIAKPNQFKEMLKKAPVKNVGIFQGVYNEETDEITHNEYIEADELDEKTRQILGNEEIVILS
ncbi:MAG: hypothetical protein PUE54_10855 [Bacteroidales bacterium]|nr:hypothetical protein [Bacteroidales bacterium]